MKAKVISIGDPSKAASFIGVGSEFDIVDDKIHFTPQGPAFYIHSPKGKLYCFMMDCSILGGGDWEIVRNNPNDKYDRAMGVL